MLLLLSSKRPKRLCFLSLALAARLTRDNHPKKRNARRRKNVELPQTKHKKDVKLPGLLANLLLR
jgi:hypothetical protein